MGGLGPLVPLLRALPFALALPLPGLAARLALGLVLALCVTVPGSPDASVIAFELVRGLALGLAVTLPLLAARWVGTLFDAVVAPRGRELAFREVTTLLAWVIFAAVGGISRLAAVYLGSYARWPVGTTPAAGELLPALLRGGVDFLALAAQLALPTLLALALVEGVAGVVMRLEVGASFEVGALSLARASRPVLAMLMLVASLAIFAHGIATFAR